MMKKQILKLGKALNKVELKSINGGKKRCSTHAQCGIQCCNTAGWCQNLGANTGYLCDGSLL